MKNLAGVPECDVDIRQELEASGIEIVEVGRSPSEVPFSLAGKQGNWMFKRAWYYWIATASEGKGIPENEAEKLNAKWFSEVRVIGFMGGTQVKDWLSAQHTIDCYHIDTQKGLNAFADLVRTLAK